LTFLKTYEIVFSTSKGRTMMKRVTKKLQKEYIRNKLATVPQWALRCLEVVYANQTEDEKVFDSVSHNNNVGFTGTDGGFLSSLAKQYERRGQLSERQMPFVMKKMPKYWKQVLAVTDEKKLVLCMHRDGILTDEDVEGYEQKLFVEAMG
jgi:hypothetical protein